MEQVCVVEISGKNSEGKSESTSGSGIIVNATHGLVISHASLLYPFTDSHNPINYADNNNVRYKVLVQTPEKNKKKQVTLNASSALEKEYNKTLDHVDDNVLHSKLIKTHYAENVLIWECKAFKDSLRKLMSKYDGWKFADDPALSTVKQGAKSQEIEAKDDIDHEKLNSLLSCFIMLKLENWTPQTSMIDVPVYPSVQLRIGQTCRVLGTPFGTLSPAVFMNSLSSGVISNVSGVNNALILTDARCIPGTEGGPLCIQKNNHRQIAGLVVTSLCWKTNEWIGLSVACSFSEILSSLQESLQFDESAIIQSIKSRVSTLAVEAKPQDKQVINQPDMRSVVFVRAATSWGSGIVIDGASGLILTCSHVIKDAKAPAVRVRSHTRLNIWYNVEIVYSTPLSKVFDVAILKLLNYTPDSLPQANICSDVKKGMTVYAVGHALFDSQHNLSPTMTRGNISTVVSRGHMPVILQSSCAVHSGASGGALMTPEGLVAGLITCNSRDTDSGACFPHVNLSVPLPTIWPILRHYIQNKDVKILKHLNVEDMVIASLWKLQRYIHQTLSRL
ncbi:unnamed protein product [Owenia fusiformis]|uniref:Peroxisomal leader peptide-processing protease n=1 Tax=Owenia fusiformis TaxID=6347 RepID=A0A8S4P4C3_OWEFU|nr:unnamed protein product [Owenia fusiformis]